jgi:diadenosine tetraphosphate (Ap4A) HIT family hydrolase
MPTSRECRSCQWIENPAEVVGGVLPVGKRSKWRVNHYQSGEAILGWLVLQPVEHKWTVDELSDETLDDLGSALGSVQRAMKRVWTAVFPDDLLERIHTTSFMESEFDKYKSPPALTFFFHIHIFLIPRSQGLGKVIRRELATAPGVKQYVPWDDYQIFHRIKNRDASDLIEKNVPWDDLQKYINPHGEAGKQAWKDKIEKFMNQLRGQ